MRVIIDRVKLLDREVVDSHQSHALLDEPVGRVGFQEHKVLLEASFVPKRPVASLKQDALDAAMGFDVASSIWSTRAGPQSDSSGSASTVVPSLIKWRGASTCVPVWEPRERLVTLAGSPALIWERGVSSGPGSSGQTGMPAVSGSVMS